MKRSTKITLIVAAALILMGIAIMAVAISSTDMYFHGFSTGRYITTDQLVTDDFSKINIATDTADISFYPSEDGNCRIVGYEEEKCLHSVSVKDDTIWVKVQDERKWYDHIGINIGSPKIEIYLPKDEYELLYLRGSTSDVNMPEDISFGEVDIKLSTGDINVKNISAGSLSLSVSTGKVRCEGVNCEGEFRLTVTTGDAVLKNINCSSFTTNGSTGKLQIDELIAAEVIDIERITGDVNFTSCDGGEIYILTDTGHVKGSFKSEKIFFAESNTGDIDVPKSTIGGICEVTTDTGDIKITIE